jgi:hypothetical protein
MSTYLVTLRVDKGWLDWLNEATDVQVEDGEVLSWVSTVKEDN